MKATAILLLALVFTLSCASKSVNDNKPVKKNGGTSADALDKEFLKEGFIGSELFRVVIVTEKDNCKTSEAEILDLAQKRAAAILKNFLISENRIYDKNASAGVLNLISDNGSLIPIRTSCSGNRVFYLDIKKHNIREYLKSSTNPR